MTRQKLRIKRVYHRRSRETAFPRHRFHGDPGGWEEFRTTYDAELEEPAAQTAVRSLLDQLRREPVTLLFAARDEARNNAVALKEWLDKLTA